MDSIKILVATYTQELPIEEIMDTFLKLRIKARRIIDSDNSNTLSSGII